VATAALAQATDSAQVSGSAGKSSEPAWITESNRQSQILLDIMAKYAPESAAQLGVEGHDGDVLDLKPNMVARQKADFEAAIARLTSARDAAKDPLLKQDLEILVDAGQQQLDTLALENRLMLPYFGVAEMIFDSFRSLLDARIPKERQKAALVRLRRYAGSERGYEPITELARARTEERLNEKSLTGPWTVELEQDLSNEPRFIKGTRDLLAASGLEGWQKDFAKLEKQIKEYDAWVRSAVMPHARKTNRLPPQIYADNLKQFGVTMSPQEIMERALLAYAQLREELDSLAGPVAAQHGWKTSNYRDVIRELKKQRIPKDQLMPFYRKRLEDIEAIVRKEQLITLPTRAAVIRLGTEAESAAQPAPHLDTPRLIGNTGEPAEFVLPVSNPNAKPGVEMDDFTYDSIGWTLTAHEARPGHELQFARMLEHGVSNARAIFAFNSANVEGWALYAEAMLRPFLPPEGQIGTLQMRLMRAARAFLDPMLNLGLIEPEAAKRVLMEEVVLSEPMARQEVDRYTFRAPGQATSYFFGYTRIETLRARAELTMGDRFNAKAYHDFIVNEGLLPLDLLQKAVMERFAGASPASAAN
jgi:uncharacterized protein (DUF885 family)